MNDNFNSQKEKLLSLSHEINLLRQQVNFLLRNEKELGLLDLDVLMNRTHTIYDTLCSIDLGSQGENEDFDLDPEALAGMFGVSLQEEGQTEEQVSELVENQEDVQQLMDEPPVEEELPKMEATLPQEEENVPQMEEVQPEIEEMQPEIVETQPEIVETQPEIEEVQLPVEEKLPQEEETTPQEDDNEPVAVAEEQSNPTPLGDEFGFFFRFEDATPAEEEPRDEPVAMDDKLVHFVEEVPEDQIPERDLVEGDELVKDNPFEMPVMDDEKTENEPITTEIPAEEIPVSEGAYRFFEKDDTTDFELAPPETLGDKMLHEDRSLAAKFQQDPVRDLKTAIGINDKFLFVNELFGGSMEKYNKSIENLNDLKTLNGAMIYLNELKIELQWNSSNEAYRKLSELISRKFE